MTTTLTDRYSVARQQLEAVGQAHVLTFYDRLDEAGRDRLLSQIEDIDWRQIAQLVESHVKNKPMVALPEKIDPAPWYPHQPTPELRDKYREARALGERLIRENKVAAFTVAGGQGTRLGWDAPKGTFPATPVRKASLFQCMAEYIIKTQRKYNAIVPWYIMTSPINDGPTRAFFEENNYFGLDPKNVMFFTQEMMPAMDLATGNVLLEAPDALALAPNGHGGSLKALYKRGAIDDMKRRGIEQISYVQVDNPIVRVVDPLFIGLHALDGAQMSSKMLPKAYPKEKLGNFCMVDGKVTVIEYSDLPDELAEQRTETGELRFRAGSIAIHVIRVDFVESLNHAEDGFRLPFHRAEKKVPYLDLRTGQRIEPDKPNAVKLEMFVFDALPLCEMSIIYESDRIDEFAPIKNAEGVDSPASSRQIQSERAGRWLEAMGVKVPRDADGSVNALIDLSPLTAIEPEDLRGVDLPREIAPGASVVL